MVSIATFWDGNSNSEHECEICINECLYEETDIESAESDITPTLKFVEIRCMFTFH